MRVQGGGASALIYHDRGRKAPVVFPTVRPEVLSGMARDARTLSTEELRKLLAAREAKEKNQRKQLREAYDRDRDKYVVDLLAQMEQMGERMRKLKVRSARTGNALHERMYAAYGRAKRRPLDHISLVSSDGTCKVVIERQHRCAYDETSTVAIDMIKQVLRERFEGRNKAMYAIIDDILMKNRKGDYDERLVAKLRKHEAAMNNRRFSEALAILAESYKPTSSQVYIRGYRKNANGVWQEVPMSWSSMASA